jgi:hypothetical protein
MSNQLFHGALEAVASQVLIGGILGGLFMLLLSLWDQAKGIFGPPSGELPPPDRQEPADKTSEGNQTTRATQPQTEPARFFVVSSRRRRRGPMAVFKRH